ncbi:MAG: class I SAM-dependent methyltransferase, partial [Microcoleaceae cyanobacterium]
KTLQLLADSTSEQESEILNYPYANLSLIEFAELPEMQNIVANKFLEKQSLNDFYFVGLQEFFSEDLQVLEYQLNWPKYQIFNFNTNPDPEYVKFLQNTWSNQDIINKISRLNQLDLDIYEEALSLQKKRCYSAITTKFYDITENDKNLIDNGFQPVEVNISPVLSWGTIDVAGIRNSVLYLSGWVASLNMGEVDQLQIAVGNTKFSFFEQTLRIPSIDVAVLHPLLQGSDEARFRIKLILSESLLHKIDHEIITVIPTFQGRPGNILVKVFSPILPAPSLTNIGMAGFTSTEEFNLMAWQFLGYLLQRCGVKSNHRILDVGCNTGLVPYGLVHLLTEGSYTGFDLVPQFIDWATENITANFPQYQFQLQNIHHPLYHPTGAIAPDQFIFPYHDQSFDLVCVSHWFMHLQPDIFRHYLQQISRVLKPGGRCIFKCWIINPESQELIRAGRSSQNLSHQLGECWVKYPELPERALGLAEVPLLQWIEETGFIIQERAYGAWCGRTSNITNDLVILVKPAINN